MREYRSVHPDHARSMDTETLRKNFHVSGLFEPGALHLAYSHEDRVIILGAIPKVEALSLPNDVSRVTGTDYMLQRREIGIINVGAPGAVIADGTRFELGREEGLYIGAGTKEVSFVSDDPADPACFYANSAPAHRALPAKKITQAESSPVTLGSRDSNNERTIYRFLHPDVVETCQLLMGLTKLGDGSNWNTMPPHLHDRRMETYFYFGIDDDAMVVHMMGEPGETRHLIMRDKDVAISPPWSIHCGCGTGAYSFIWCMAGENQVFEDMDMVDVRDLY